MAGLVVTSALITTDHFSRTLRARKRHPLHNELRLTDVPKPVTSPCKWVIMTQHLCSGRRHHSCTVPWAPDSPHLQPTSKVFGTVPSATLANLASYRQG
jgi:hypothetical protein